MEGLRARAHLVPLFCGLVQGTVHYVFELDRLGASKAGGCSHHNLMQRRVDTARGRSEPAGGRGGEKRSQRWGAATLGLLSTILLARFVSEKPAKTTEWTAPILVHASCVITESRGVSGRTFGLRARDRGLTMVIGIAGIMGR